MRIETIVRSAAALLCAGLICPGTSHAARHGFNLNINGDAETCADLKVSSNDGEVVKLSDMMTMTRAEAPLLEMSGDRSHILVRGWDKATYSVETCKLAVAATRAEAEQMARGISVTRSAGRLSMSGPAESENAQWMAVFLIHAPKDASVDLETKNGPLSVRDLSGTVKLRAANGPIAIRDCGGTVDAQTTNGPIAFTGDRGEVTLHATNGPISLKLGSDAWNGSRLEARTINGPLAVSVPENFRSGMRLETAGHSPMTCSAGPCRNAFRDADGRTLQINGASDTIRLSTENGPVAIHAESAKARLF